MKTHIKRHWLFTQSKEEVWEYLTKPELIAKWLMPNNFKLEEGHEFTFTTNPIPQLGLSGTFYCKVIEIVPIQKLVYSWQGGVSKTNPTLETIVEWTLESKGEGTKLNLIHTGFTKDNESILNAMYGGWDDHIQKILKDLNTKNNVHT